MALMHCAPVEAPLGDVSARHADEINAARAGAGLGPVVPSRALYDIAAAHAQDMTTQGYFGHRGSDGRLIDRRARDQGYAYCDVAENLAKGQRGFGLVMRHWRGSPTHWRNILHPRVSEFGLARGAGNLWVLVLGRPGCAGSKASIFLQP